MTSPLSPLSPLFLPTGTVYGVLLNFQAETEALAPQMNAPPYQAPPKAPVLYVKPANTWSQNGTDIAVPVGAAEVELGASIAMVIGRDLRAANEDTALAALAGYVLVNDLSLPHTSFFRPPVKYKCVDGFLGIGPEMRPAGPSIDPSHFTLELRVNGVLRQSVRFSHLVRSAARLLADVSAFMTLRRGDLLLLGCDAGRPLARAGDHITLNAPGFASLHNQLTAEAAPQ